MKIHQLPMGARFAYEGQEYVKTGPLLATADGKQRLIPKYAVLQVLDGSQPVAEKKAAALSRADVLAAFAAYHARCAALLPQERQAELEAARAAFLRALG
jgi:hypothetical protein